MVAYGYILPSKNRELRLKNLDIALKNNALALSNATLRTKAITEIKKEEDKAILTSTAISDPNALTDLANTKVDEVRPTESAGSQYAKVDEVRPAELAGSQYAKVDEVRSLIEPIFGTKENEVRPATFASSSNLAVDLKDYVQGLIDKMYQIEYNVAKQNIEELNKYNQRENLKNKGSIIESRTREKKDLLIKELKDAIIFVDKEIQKNKIYLVSLYNSYKVPMNERLTPDLNNLTQLRNEISYVVNEYDVGQFADTSENRVKENSKLLFKEIIKQSKIKKKKLNNLIKLIINKYGIYSDKQLRYLTNKLNIPLNYIGFVEDLKELKKNGGYIFNLGNQEIQGTHWTALYKEGTEAFYFDSFAVPFEDKLLEIAENNCKLIGALAILFS